QEQDRVEVHDAEKVGYLRFVTGYYSYIFVGLYVIELVFSVLVLLPRSILANLIKQNSGPLWSLAQKRLLEARYLREMRIDGALVLLLFAASFYAYGTFWPYLAVALFLRGVQISVANASYHYGTPLNETRFANNFSLSPGFARAILHFNLHHVHHEHPGLPWNGLPDAYERGDFACDTTYMDGMLRQFHGPIDVRALPQTTR
ncbi:MAG: fatty acid desaturase, partial [Fimbriimonadaceae bacterium]|nr:fatty acid desaturase [Alphaproteobacteria bacterium]